MFCKIFLIIFVQVLNSQGRLLLINFTPISGNTRSTYMLCTDLMRNSTRSQLGLRRAFPWRSKTSIRALQRPAFNRQGMLYSWHYNPLVATGEFICGRNLEEVRAFKMSEKGLLRPEAATKTAPLGGNVVIRMLPVTSSNDVTTASTPRKTTWLKDGRPLDENDPRIWTAENGGRALVIKNVTKHDAGIYMARLSGQPYYYSAATRLYVRDCPLNTWSLNCSRPCIVCNNGGVCSASSGECDCPIGFYGRHCERACPLNRFGVNCTLSCDDVTNDVTCRGVQMCLTTGCHCATGWRGANCDEVCPPNTYGPDCQQRCLCRNNGTCDAQRGCVCMRGWFGPSCKSRVKINSDVIINQMNNGSTLPTERAPNISSVRAIPSFQINRNQEVRVECSVTGIPLPEQGEIILMGENDVEIYPVRNSMTSSHTTSSFDIIMTSYIGPYRCQATTSAGKATKDFNFTISELPTPLHPPYFITRSPTRLVIGLNSRNYTGDGPITAREVWYKQKSERFFKISKRQLTGNDTVTITELKPATKYNVRVVLSREGGVSGQGVPGPVATMETDCDKPSLPPKITSIYAIGNTTLFLRWEIPPTDKLNGDILGHRIFHRELGTWSTSNWRMLQQSYQQTNTKNQYRNTATVKQLKPLAVYLVRMKLYNCAGDSPISKPVRVTMGELDTPIGPDVTMTNRTSSSLSYAWLTPSNTQQYTIVSYEIMFEEVGDDSPNSFKYDGNTTSQTSSWTFHDLVPFTSYSFKVRAYTHEGPGSYSDVIINQTMEDAPSEPLNLQADVITSDEIHLRWETPLHPNGVLRGYEAEVLKGAGPWMSIIDELTNQTNLLVKNLDEYTSYSFRVRTMTITMGPWCDVINVMTMSTVPLQSPQIISVKVTSPQSVIVTWLPIPPSPYVTEVTQYEVIYTDDIRQNDKHWRSKVVPGDVLTMVVEELKPDTVYFFKVAAKTQNIGSFSIQSTVRTASLGLPPPPYGATVSNVTSSSAVIHWSTRGGYRVTIVKLVYYQKGGSPIRLLENQEKRKKSLTSLQPNTLYTVELIAKNYVGDSSGNPLLTFHTKAGKDGTSIYEDTNLNLPFHRTMMFKIGMGILGGLLIVIVIGFIVAYYRCRSVTRKRMNPPAPRVEMDCLTATTRASTFGSTSQGGGIHSRSATLMSSYSLRSGNSRAPSTYSGQIFPESLSIPWENILFEDIPLGVGNFGQVVKAVVQKDDKLIQTAVKMLKDGCTLEDKRDFLAEVDTMMRIGNHRHVVALVGACEHDHVMYLCTEFAPLGSLLQFLRRSRRLEGSNGTYTSLSQSQLLKFAHDVTQGMTYLSEKQIIHRDLAARNILLGDGYVCKIADFGLSRGEGVYVKKTVSRLPIRWMAIESLNYNVYTSKSDVWSFGVLLWEIVSLGGTPYCGMSCAELYEKLPTGYRMEKPLNCDDEVYGLMYQCWKNRPYDRPTFSQLSIALERMCDARSSRNYVNTAIFDDFKFANIDVNEEEA
nr:tyrosine-protein kinase receptor Tie-2-like [Ciona intestinalis]|eukprot:XP_009861650.2 tyrosine-protein kinase receptor Tie-2-like [Ciona intestinalis]